MGVVDVGLSGSAVAVAASPFSSRHVAASRHRTNRPPPLPDALSRRRLSLTVDGSRLLGSGVVSGEFENSM